MYFGSQKRNESGVIFPAVVNPLQAKVEWSLLKDVVKEPHYPHREVVYTVALHFQVSWRHFSKFD